MIGQKGGSTRLGVRRPGSVLWLPLLWFYGLHLSFTIQTMDRAGISGTSLHTLEQVGGSLYTGSVKVNPSTLG